MHAAERPRALDTVVTLLVILVSGNPATLSWHPQAVFIAVLLFLVCIAVARGSLTVTVTELAVMGAFSAISLLHLAIFSTGVASAIAGFWVRLLIAFLAVRVIVHFHLCYVTVIYFLAALSLGFYGAQQVLGLIDFDLRSALSGYTLLSDERVHIGLHNFHQAEEAHRNSGMFWEPGAFAGYLLLGLIFLAGYRDHYSERQYRSVLFVLVLAIVTTLSAAGYLLLPLVLAMHLLPRLRKMSAALRVLSISILVSLAAVAMVSIYWELPFVGEKIVHQLQSATEDTAGAELTRFGNIVYDMEFIRSRPLTGWSPHPATRTTLDPYIAELFAGQGNGLTGFIVKFGLLGLVVFLFATYRTFSRVFFESTSRSLFATALVLAMLNGEAFLNYPLVMTLMFPIRQRFLMNAQVRALELSSITPKG